MGSQGQFAKQNIPDPTAMCLTPGNPAYSEIPEE